MPGDWEHAEQVALFQWVELQRRAYPQLGELFAIPNGGKRTKATAARLAQEGVKAGVPDLFLPCARGPYHGYFIELKAIYPDGTTGKASRAQKERIARLRAAGYRADIIVGWELAAEQLLEYLKG